MGHCWTTCCICTAVGWGIPISTITPICRSSLPESAAGNMKGGRHLSYDQATPLANLHLTLLNKVGVRLESFADSNDTVDALFEPLSA